MDYIDSVRKQFAYYKLLAENTFDQLSDEELNWQCKIESNSIASIVKHLSGNMLSRWTDFLVTDGEKDWRNRDSEFQFSYLTREEIINQWSKGWQCLFGALDMLTDEDLSKIIYIRNMGHTVHEAINRQLAHYPYHIGQIVFIGKMILGDKWNSISIPLNRSGQYNEVKFSQSKSIRHFTEDYLLDQDPL